MNLNPVEWAKAQDLLTRLVAALAPLTLTLHLKIVPASLFLKNRFTIPPSEAQDGLSPSPIRQPVRILKALQREVEELMLELPPQEEGEGIQPAAVTAPEGQLEKPVSHPEEHRLAAQAQKLPVQAQKLIAQVQEAIGELANSTYLQAPQSTPLRIVLNKLRPGLDRIIASIAQSLEFAPPSIRPAIPRSMREEIVLQSTKCEPERPPSRLPHPSAPLLLRKKKPLLATSQKVDWPPEKKKGVGMEAEVQPSASRPGSGKEEKLLPKRVESIVLPGIPFTPGTKARYFGPKKETEGVLV